MFDWPLICFADTDVDNDVMVSPLLLLQPLLLLASSTNDDGDDERLINAANNITDGTAAALMPIPMLLIWLIDDVYITAPNAANATNAMINVRIAAVRPIYDAAAATIGLETGSLV